MILASEPRTIDSPTALRIARVADVLGNIFNLKERSI